MRYVFLSILFWGLIGCEFAQKESTYSREEFKEFLDLNCEARKLKNERFTLAEKLRENEAFVSNPDSLKDALASQSRELAERIRVKLNQMTGEMSLDEKRAFNDTLEARISKLNCE